MAKRNMERHDSYEAEKSAHDMKDKRYFANMPPEVKMHAYPKQDYGIRDGSLDDTIRGIDEDDRFNEKKVRDHMSDSMY